MRHFRHLRKFAICQTRISEWHYSISRNDIVKIFLYLCFKSISRLQILYTKSRNSYTVFNYLSMIYRNVIHKLPNRCGVEITRVVYDSIYCVVNLNFGKCVINKKWPSNSFKYKQRILFALLFYRSDKISWQHLILLSMKFVCNKRSILVNLQIFTRHINTRHSQKSLNCRYMMICH